MAKLSYLRIITLLIVTLISGCGDEKTKTTSSKVMEDSYATTSVAGKKVLYLDSYNQEELSSKSTREACRKILQEHGIKFRVFYIDAEKNETEDKIQKKVKEARDIIEDWSPDIVIASDDEVSKYIVEPHYKETDQAIVFTGINCDAEKYGYPYSNATGQIEVEHVKETISLLKSVAKGSRVSFLGANNFSNRQCLRHYQTKLGLKFTKIELIDTFDQWKQKYIELQNSSDMIFLRDNSDIKDWSDEEAKNFTLTHSKIPSGTVLAEMSNCAMISKAKDHSEYGEYSANTAIKILRGKSPSEIPISTNKRVSLYINMALARKNEITFPTNLLEQAHMVGIAPSKILVVNSYHKGYPWSDNIETGIQRILNSSNNSLTTRFIRMDTKLNQSEVFKKAAATRAYKIIKEWQPDIVIAADDNASKYLVVPYLKDKSTPVVFCGINWDAAIYGFPCKNVTGMIEVDAINELIKILQVHAKGPRMAIIGSPTFSNNKNMIQYKNRLKLKFSHEIFPQTFEEWKQEYVRVQSEADLVIFMGMNGIQNWDHDEAVKHILQHSKIPSGGLGDYLIPYSLVAYGKIAEEQGVWAGTAALDIINGKSPEDIPIERNKRFKTLLNMPIARKLGIVFPMDLINQAALHNPEIKQ